MPFFNNSEAQTAYKKMLFITIAMRKHSTPTNILSRNNVIIMKHQNLYLNREILLYMDI